MKTRHAALLSLTFLLAACHKSGTNAGGACTSDSACASGLTCVSGVCVFPDGGGTTAASGTSAAGGSTASTGTTATTGTTNGSSGTTGVRQDGGPSCLLPASSCDPTATSAPCCSGICASNDAGAFTCQVSSFCGPSGMACTQPTDCCSLNCTGGVCDGNSCAQIGGSCSGNADCCGGNCQNGTCAAVAGGSCKTLGESCGAAGDFCSTNCQGGTCQRAYTCSAVSDLCYADGDCCSGSCSANGDGGSGRCIALSGGGSGGCSSDGEPCASGTNCCSRLCVDPGAGATVCAPASGCRLTGDLCRTDADCCGANGNGVTCNVSAGQTIGRCTNPTGCEPVGDICGAFGSNARQDCCDGHKSVCQLDSEGIARCFGGCQGNCGNQCPEGYDSDHDAGCCVSAGTACQFRDQCCDGNPCLPDATGVLTCTPPPACGNAGTACSPSDGGGCCDGLYCLSSGGELGGSACQALLPDAGVVIFPDGGLLPSDGGSPSDAGPVCNGNGAACTDAPECCSKYCVNGVCSPQPTCQPQNGTCTASSDCCLGLSCNVPVGSVSGSCESGSSCGQPGQACTNTSTCCSGLTCVDDTSNVCSGGTGCTCSVIFQ